MPTLVRLAIAALPAFCLVWLSAFAYAALVQHVLGPQQWWRAYAAARLAVEVLTFIPFALVFALLARRLFPRGAVAASLACTLVAMAALFAPTAALSFELLLPMLRLNAEFILTFVLGVPLAVVVIRRGRAGSS